MKTFNQRLIIRVAVIIGSALIAAMLTIFVLLYFIDPNNYKKHLTNKFFQATGRQLLLKGPIALKIYPDIHIIAKNIEITNPKELPKGNFVEVESIDIHISILSLLKGTITVNKSIIDGLHLYLVKDKQVNNWSFNLSTERDISKGSKINLVLKDLLIKNSIVTYKDFGKNINIQTKVFNLAINRSRGSINFIKDQIYFNDANINFNNEFYAKLYGQVIYEPTLTYNGHIVIESFSLDKISGTLGLDKILPGFINRPAYSKISLSSSLQGTKNSFNFNNLLLVLNQANIEGNILTNLKPYTLNQNLSINSVEISDFIDLNGFKLKLESAEFSGNIVSKSMTDLTNLNGKEQLNINKITLYGFDVKRFSKQTTKLINDISTLNRLVTYTQTRATIEELRKSINRLQSQRKKNYSDISNLGSLKINTVAKNGYVSIPECKLTGPDISGTCKGFINFQTKSFNLIFQGRLLPHGEQSLINYIYFPYYFRGRFSNIDSGLDWQSIAKQTTNYYKTSDKDKPVLSKALDSITGIFKDESK